MDQCKTSENETALAVIDNLPRKSIRKSEAFVMSGNTLISFDRSISSTHAKLLGDQLPPNADVCSSSSFENMSSTTIDTTKSLQNIKIDANDDSKTMENNEENMVVYESGDYVKKHEILKEVESEKINLDKSFSNEKFIVDDSPKNLQKYSVEDFQSSDQQIPKCSKISDLEKSEVFFTPSQQNSFVRVDESFFTTVETPERTLRKSESNNIFQKNEKSEISGSKQDNLDEPALKFSAEKEDERSVIEENEFVKDKTEGEHEINETAYTTANDIQSSETRLIGKAERVANKIYKCVQCSEECAENELNKMDQFSLLVLIKYLEYFRFPSIRVDTALKMFLGRIKIRGELSDREKMIRVFSARFLEFNPAGFETLDEIQIISCALLLLNSGFHGEKKKSITMNEFVTIFENLPGKYGKHLLKTLYLSVKEIPLTENQFVFERSDKSFEEDLKFLISLGFKNDEVECFSGPLIKKVVRNENGSKVKFGKRSWKCVNVRIEGLKMYFKNEENAKSSKSSEKSISLHHSLAEPAFNYSKRANVMRLRMANGGEILLEAGNQNELLELCEIINRLAAKYSSPTRSLMEADKPEYAKMPKYPKIPLFLPITKQIELYSWKIMEIKRMIDIISESMLSKKTTKASKRLNVLYFEKRRYDKYLSILAKEVN